MASIWKSVEKLKKNKGQTTTKKKCVEYNKNTVNFYVKADLPPGPQHPFCWLSEG